MARDHGFSPRGHLAFFTCLQLLVYIDRAALSGLLPSIRKSFGISNWQSGLLGSGFMGGFMVASPILAIVGTDIRALPVMGMGMLVWMCAVLITYLADAYNLLLFARIIAGVGEAAFCSLAPPIIDDAAPHPRRSFYLSIYFAAIFVGMALGFALQAPFKGWLDGRPIFAGEALAVAPFCAVLLFMPGRFAVFRHARAKSNSRFPTLDSFENIVTVESELLSAGERDRLDAQTFEHVEGCPSEKASAADTVAFRLEPEKSPSTHDSLITKISIVLSDRIYVSLVLGYAASIFAIGGFGFWAPTYLEEELHFDRTNSGLLLSSVTALSGIFGTAAGGVLVDKYCARIGLQRGRALAVDRVLAASRIAFGCAVVGLPLALVAAASDSAVTFICVLGLVEFVIFMSTAPVNIAMMETVPTNLRGLALGICTFVMHLLGDLSPPLLIGYLRDVTASLRLGVWLLSTWLVWCVLFWGVAVLLAQRIEASAGGDGLIGT
eukprot:TRINITY_DN57777_c0_g1_i1.p1 TRINITY_DN57777_c0_g1~~TRINITY_DN57777_c0_g1_i1.p1  ORF type:complete len:510 (+),score=39.42 TRINITY_DN57777_c0_g1_i1:53-1531(+)